ncbi:alpha/beta hydrolase [Streptomyces beijiangensis]|uniref:Alpha/beta-hydrolase family protein n=1 Tax=Streptomyces beijiangensis TaxID=163361 RepID=A0A939FEL0_9ACTN|nr:alpha/beta-hydrolase family protein [Streptomyces beijiangensis]MBO0517705.1 alpha/beta-hydrolase family protein [Streptomyces beijiangensis]
MRKVAPGKEPFRQRFIGFAQQPFWERPDSSYLVRRWPDFTAVCCATVFFWMSLTPSLVPRPWFLQGLVGGISAAIGYAVGSVASTVCRALFRWRPGRTTRAGLWQAYWVLSPVLAVVLITESAHMQRRLRELQGVPESLTWHTPMIALIAVVLWALILLVARSIRLGSRRLIRLLHRFVPLPVAIGVGLVLSVLSVGVGLRNVVFQRGVIDIADRMAYSVNGGTRGGIEKPVSPLVSGGPGSLVAWKELGFQGRNFIGSVLTRDQITAFTGRPAKDPVRVYISASAPEAFSDDEDPFKGKAQLAVRELERTGAFDRDVLAIAGTTGTGWINSDISEPLEYLHDGNTAIVAVQYSYLPSWVSFLVDKERAAQATRDLVDAVRAKWATLPEGRRPKLVVTGESLGGYAVESSFDGVDDLLAKTDGALVIGTPNFAPMSEEIRDHRDAGSPVWRPQYDGGRNVRVAQFPEADLKRPEAAWGHPRVVYLQNASDPVVWWSTDLLLRRPQWLDKPLGPDITSEIRWFPLVTFWQTTVDMAVSYGVEAPHGHRYGAGPVDGWAAVVPREGWTAQDTARLRRHIEQRENPY